jgi:hypothetical protein
MPQAEFYRFSTCLMVGAGMLMIMDASLISPWNLRALVGDNLRTDQRTLGLAYKQH